LGAIPKETKYSDDDFDASSTSGEIKLNHIRDVATKQLLKRIGSDDEKPLSQLGSLKNLKAESANTAMKTIQQSDRKSESDFDDDDPLSLLGSRKA
jgi:hypothetical protein